MNKEEKLEKEIIKYLEQIINESILDEIDNNEIYCCDCIDSSIKYDNSIKIDSYIYRKNIVKTFIRIFKENNMLKIKKKKGVKNDKRRKRI